jgi:hypothetical protein
MRVDDFNAAKRPSTFNVNIAQRGSTYRLNGFQPNSTPGNPSPALSCRIALESPPYLLTAFARSVLISTLMNPEIINDNRPAKRNRSGGGRAFHSRLESFVDFIREQRQRRRTWKEIAAALSGEKGCTITAQGVHQFYRRHLQRHAKGNWEDAANHSESQPTRPSAAASRPQPGSAPLPPQVPFKRPDRSNININEQFP